MIGLYLMWFSLALSTFFLIFPLEDEVTFMYSDMVLSKENYAYFLFEHLNTLILSVVILISGKKFRFAYGVFVAIIVIDTIDYMLTYATPWPFLPVSWNVIKVCIFGLVVIHEQWKSLRS